MVVSSELSGQRIEERQDSRPDAFVHAFNGLLARIIHERSAFVNNAPTGTASAAPVGFDPAAWAGLKASPERRPAKAGRSRSPEGGYSPLRE